MMKTPILAVVLFMLLCCTSGSHRKEARTSFVFDNDNMLPSSDEKRFDALFRKHESKTGNELVLVTTPDYGTDTSLRWFAVNFGRKHGVGKKDRDNGLVIAFCAPQRTIFIATGKGTEKVLPDQTVQRMIDSLMIPRFKEEQYLEGLWAGSEAIVKYLEQPEHKVE